MYKIGSVGRTFVQKLFLLGLPQPSHYELKKFLSHSCHKIFRVSGLNTGSVMIGISETLIFLRPKDGGPPERFGRSELHDWGFRTHWTTC